MASVLVCQTLANVVAHSKQCSGRQIANYPSAGLRTWSIRPRSLSCSHRQLCKLRAAQATSDDVTVTEEVLESEVDVVEEEGGESLDDVQVWAQEQLKALEEEVEHAAPAQYSLSFLWLDKNVAVAVDQVFAEDQRSPMTEYFFWPRKDAWEELKTCLEARPWVSERDKVLLLNKTTEVINFWQDEEFWLQNNRKHSLQEAQEAFPDCKFLGC